MTGLVSNSHAPHTDVSVNDGPHIRRWSHKIIMLQYNIIRTAVLQLPTVFSTVTCCAVPAVSLDFSVTYSFRPYHGPGVDSAPSENEYQEHFLGLKAAGA